jgi:hypothetical protein
MDPGGVAYFNISVEGFWRSFFAAVLIAPAYVGLIIVRDIGLSPEVADSGPLPETFNFLPEVFTYIMGWIIWPLAMLIVVRLLNQTQNYVPYIIVYNWASVIQIAILLPVAILTRGGIFPEQAAAIIGIIATLVVLFYLWFVTRTVLQVRDWAAAGVVVMDVLIGVLISNLGSAIFL